MAKFHGIVGYVHTEETSPGIHEEVVTERDCIGDILRNNQRWENGEKVNDDLTINNRFSIVTDEFILQNIKNMKYLEWMGTHWEISSIEINRPRIILTIGGVYNGK